MECSVHFYDCISKLLNSIDQYALKIWFGTNPKMLLNKEPLNWANDGTLW